MKRSALSIAALLALIFTGAVQAQLVVNGSFETGDFTAWTVNDPSGGTLINLNPDGLANTGNYYALLGATSPDTGSLSQAINTTPGQTYQLSFALASDRSTSVDNSFEVLWNNVPIYSATNIPAPGVFNPYVNFTFDNLVAAAAGTTLLEFRYVNNDDFFRLDDVALLAVPEMPATSFVLLGFLFFGAVYFRRNKVSRASVSE